MSVPAYERTVVDIRQGPDAALVEAMSRAAHAEWRDIIGFPQRWEDCNRDDADTIRLGMFAGLQAARAFAKARKPA